MTLAATAVMSIAAFSAFAQEDTLAAPAKKDVPAAEKSVVDAKSDLRLAKLDSAADYNMFKTAAQMKISNNKKEIATLKARKSNDTKEVKRRYDQKLTALEIRNDELQGKIDRSGTTETSKWTSFKSEFSQEMNELGQGFKDIDKTK